jgi:hypothetical protein
MERAHAAEVVAGVVDLFALHWIEFRLQQPGVLRVMRRAEGPVSRGFLSGVALLLILIPVTNVNRKTLARRALLVRGDAADTSQAATVEGDRKRVLQPLCGPEAPEAR